MDLIIFINLNICLQIYYIFFQIVADSDKYINKKIIFISKSYKHIN